MAAALEQAGINSTIWLLKGHAFLGYWRHDATLSVISTTEVVDVVNQVDLGNIGLVETTMITKSHGGPSFTEATTAPRVKFLGGDLSEILGVTDIRQARQAQIYPLPSRATDADGNVVVTQYEPGAARQLPVRRCSGHRAVQPDRRCSCSCQPVEECATRPEPPKQAHQLLRPRRLSDRRSRTGAGQIRR